MTFGVLDQPGLRPALAFSIGLHMLVLAGIYLAGTRSPVPRPEEPAIAISVQLVRSVQPDVAAPLQNFQPVVEPDAPVEVADGQEQPAENVELTDSTENNPITEVQALSSQAVDETRSQTNPLASDPTALEQLASAVREVLKPDITDDGMPDSEQVLPFSPSTVQASVSTYVRKARPEFTSTWVSSCWLEEQERPLAECSNKTEVDYSGARQARVLVEELAADVFRDRRAATRLASLQQKDQQLYALMEGKGPTATIARELHYINKEYQMYLTGNYNLVAWNFVKMANRMDGNLEFIGSFLQFDCGSEECKYDWTGFKPELPADWARVSEDDFSIQPVIFGRGKQ